MQGIYQIKNTKNNKVYIGSSIDIDRRWKEHTKDLENNKHHSIKLQRSYNLTKDKSIFKFSIVEEVEDINKLRDREQYYINLYNSYHVGYNCCSKADNPYYSLTNNKKINKKIELNEEYEKFMKLYNPETIDLGYKFKYRLTNKLYKINIYKNMNRIITWFNENYNNYKCNIYCNGKYYLTVYDNDNNEVFSSRM